MIYNEAREYIEELKPRGIQPGLTSISALCEELGSPQNYLSIIHIAGTNGKGSAGAFLAAVLNAAGRSVGRFVSPAVGDYLEAFTIDGRPISEELYARCAEQVKAAAERLAARSIFPTSFEAETAIAFLSLRELCPDYALIECGMGGRLDSTNIISSPFVSVITSISHDHKRFLGSTIAEIAAEKSGIIKYNCPVVTCEQTDDAMEVIAAAAREHGSPLYIADDIENARYYEDKTVFDFEGEEYTIHLPGVFQPQNAATAVKAAQLLGISGENIRKGLEGAVWGYRFERIGKYILDGAHNEDAARRLAQSIRQYLPKKRPAFICGCFRDKDYDAIARITAPLAGAVYCIKPPTERGLEGETLRGAFEKYGAKAYNAGTLESALEMTADCDAVVIFGSLSILGDAKRLIQNKQKGNNNAKMR
ncbi:MAG: bifunctional folylpolyglutamate synthase/dihydrofolate synthase [Candidatus Ornithomonoglobus sp.]